MSYKQMLSVATACLIYFAAGAESVGGIIGKLDNSNADPGTVVCSNGEKPICAQNARKPQCPIKETVSNPESNIVASPEPAPTLLGCNAGYQPACAPVTANSYEVVCAQNFATSATEVPMAATPADEPMVATPADEPMVAARTEQSAVETAVPVTGGPLIKKVADPGYTLLEKDLTCGKGKAKVKIECKAGKPMCGDTAIERKCAAPQKGWLSCSADGWLQCGRRIPLAQ